MSIIERYTWEEYRDNMKRIAEDANLSILLVRFDDHIIKLGHKFTRASFYKKLIWGPPWTDWDKPREVEQCEAINVTVKEMHAYQRKFTELGQGITAALVVEGLDDRDWNHWVFGDAEHECIVCVG